MRLPTVTERPPSVMQGDAGLDQADLARDRGADMSQKAAEDRENLGRSDDHPEPPENPGAPDDLPGPPGN